MQQKCTAPTRQHELWIAQISNTLMYISVLKYLDRYLENDDMSEVSHSSRPEWRIHTRNM